MQISVMKCPHQCQVKPVRAGQVPLIQEAEGGEDELERGGEESAGSCGRRSRWPRGRAAGRRVSACPA